MSSQKLSIVVLMMLIGLILIISDSPTTVSATSEVRKTNTNHILFTDMAKLAQSSDSLSTSLLTTINEAKLTSNDGKVSDVFGEAVAISGDTLIIGAYGNDALGNLAGAAYIFQRNGSTWSQQAKLTASDAAAGYGLGISVAIEGDTAIVGSFGDNTFGYNSGSAYIFQRNGSTWSQQAKLIANDSSANDWFGRSVAISGDTVIVGGPGDSDFSGSAYIFQRNGSTWSQQAKLIANDSSINDRFGYSVAMSGDTVIVGEDSCSYKTNCLDSGSAYIFQRNGSTWSQQAKLKANDGAALDEFGLSVAISGDIALVGAYGDDDACPSDPDPCASGSAYIFQRSGSTWSQQIKLTANDASSRGGFGFSVAIDGDTAIIGALKGPCPSNLNCFNSGSAYIFQRSDSNWSQQAKLFPADPIAGTNFGLSVGISRNTVVVGQPGSPAADIAIVGFAYVYDLTTNQPPVLEDQTFTVDENSANGALVGTIVAYDPNASLTYAIIDGNTDNAFSIDSFSGQITVNNSSVLDFETNPVFNLTVQVTDANQLSNLATITINLNNVNDLPIVTVDASTITVNEGQTATNSGTAKDEDGDVVTLSTSPAGLLVNNNNGAWSWNFTTRNGPVQSQMITITANDSHGGTGQTSFRLIVNNVAPIVGAISAPINPQPVGIVINTNASLTDPGTGDTHTATWDWEGATSAGTVNETNGSGTVSGSHSYSMPGVYTLRLTVTDDDGDSGQSLFPYVVIYDPTGGFVTGVGWITSPAGAYVANPALTGRANFGFNAKYKKGQSIPDGNTDFQFQAANLNFQSTSYEWLVVAGAGAKFKGVGTINGSGKYGFLLTATDGQVSGGGGVDKFRIKIWDKNNGDAIVYDNQLGAIDDSYTATALGGGSIVIHTSGGKASVDEASDKLAQPNRLFLPVVGRE